MVFVAAGLFFAGTIARESWRTLEARDWPVLPCEIVSSGASLDGPDERPYRFEVTYRYDSGGGTHLGRVYLPSYAGSADYRPVQLLLLRYQPGSRTTCRVNPRDPSEAVLELRSPGFSLLILFPLLFVVLGAGLVAAAWRRGGRRPGPAPLGRADAATARGMRIAGVVSLIFAVVGAGGALAMLPWMAGPLRARSWTPVTARVVSSEVRRHEGTDSEGRRSVTWRLDILYEYETGGRTYRSNRWGWFKGASSGLEGKREVARRHPPGSTLTVWVDPDDPTMALAVRGYTLLHLLFLVPLAFAGAGILFHVLTRRALSPEGPGAAWAPVEPAVAGPLVLAPGQSRIWKAAGILLFALVWNGIVSPFAWEVVQSFRRGHPDWFLALFLGPFLLVGILTLVAFVNGVLALANPATTLTVTPGVPRLGDTLRVAWRTRGATRRLERLRIVLEGSESATYRRGTDTHTETKVFARLPVADLSHPLEMVGGEASLQVPADTMHTFDGGSNAVTWRLTVEGDVPRWPDVADTWEIRVAPLAVDGRGPWAS